MGALVSHVPELLRRKGWDNPNFVLRCMQAGLSQDTAYRLIRGETLFSIDTIATVAKIFDVSTLGEVIELNGEQ